MNTGRACSVPPGDLLPLSPADFAALQNWTLRAREMCANGCGERGVYWYWFGWLCEDCDCDAD